MSEQITNLPWLLESVAKNLDEIAAKLNEEQKEGAVFDNSPKLIKETLLRALAAAGSSNKKKIIDDIVAHLKKNSTQ